MGLQRHALAVLKEDAGLEPYVDAYFIDADIMAIEVHSETTKMEVLRVLSYDFNPKLLDDLGRDGMVIKFLPLRELV
jgi:hypothetical protein